MSKGTATPTPALCLSSVLNYLHLKMSYIIIDTIKLSWVHFSGGYSWAWALGAFDVFCPLRRMPSGRLCRHKFFCKLTMLINEFFIQNIFSFSKERCFSAGFILFYIFFPSIKIVALKQSCLFLKKCSARVLGNYWKGQKAKFQWGACNAWKIEWVRSRKQ